MRSESPSNAESLSVDARARTIIGPRAEFSFGHPDDREIGERAEDISELVKGVGMLFALAGLMMAAILLMTLLPILYAVPVVASR